MLPAEAPYPERDAERPARTLRLATAAAIVLIAAASGCGSGDGPGSDADTNLKVTLDADGSGGQSPTTAEAVCTEGMDTGPCPQLADLTAADLAPISPRQACTEIYGGPDVVTVTGTLHGEAVDATLTRANGCEVLRFGHVIPLLREMFPDYDPGQALRP